jgi:ferredoxin/flavodoxin---NADP+ reductase
VSTETQSKFQVAVIGAGPAGLFAARQLAEDGAHVVLFNRDIKPGGLAEYGIYPEKYKMKEGLRKQFRQIIQMPDIDYYGNVTVSQIGDITLNDLKNAGFQAVLVTAGAQGTKWLGLPGEDIPKGVYHAKDIVYHYNKLPPYSQKEFYIGNHVALVGAGNVMLDIARWLIRTLKVEEVIAVVRRGPAEVKFDKKEMEYVIANLDRQALDQEVARATPVMQAIEQDPEAAKAFILSALPKALEPVSKTRFRFDFLASPVRIIGNAQGQVCGIEIEENKLIPANGDTKARGTGVKHESAVDTVIFCIGDKVDDSFGLPVQWNAFVKNPDPAYPVEGISYEAYDHEAQKPITGLFVAGWSREASSGLVGVARKDGERGAKAVLQYLQTLPPLRDAAEVLSNTQKLLQHIHKPVIKKEDIQRLEIAEKAEADRLLVEEFKFGSNEEMLAAMRQALETA